MERRARVVTSPQSTIAEEVAAAVVSSPRLSAGCIFTHPALAELDNLGYPQAPELESHRDSVED